MHLSFTNEMELTIQRFFYILASIGLIIVGLIVTEAVVLPLIFAILFALMMTPLCNRFERSGVGRSLSIILVFLITITSVGIIITLFSMTFANIYKDLPEIQVKIDSGFNRLENNINEWTGYSDARIENDIAENRSKILRPLWNFVEGSVSASFMTIGNFFLTMIYVFLLLYYRKGIKRVLLKKLSSKDKNDRKSLFTEIQEVINSYALSMLIVMGVLGIINSIGLWIIGIDYPFFWGFLAGLLVVIPYIGTTLGGLMPFLYALATTDTAWQPIAIVIMYFTVQQIEGNFITPKIVGSNINVNALTIILAMIAGGLIWSLAGLILALPMVAVARTIFVRYDETRKIGLLMSSSISDKY